jgi:hypothetical protein
MVERRTVLPLEGARVPVVTAACVAAIGAAHGCAAVTAAGVPVADACQSRGERARRRVHFHFSFLIQFPFLQ